MSWSTAIQASIIPLTEVGFAVLTIGSSPAPLLMSPTTFPLIFEPLVPQRRDKGEVFQSPFKLFHLIQEEEVFSVRAPE